jgi:hypothetical protein
MRRLLALMAVGLFVLASLTGCTIVSPMNGSLYTGMTGPVAVGPAASSPKKGEAKVTGIVGVATGDASIEAAMKAGGITKIHHVDTKLMNILGVYTEYTTIVYGE